MNDDPQAFAAVVKRVRVECGREQAFRVFTERMGTWWPVETHSITAAEDGSHPPQAVVFEQAAGGRVYERAEDGRSCDWATILVYEPPHRIVLEWRVNPARPSTEVEVTFTVDGDGTLVELEHRGWQHDPEEGATWRSGYDSGWVSVLERFVEAAASPES